MSESTHNNAATIAAEKLSHARTCLYRIEYEVQPLADALALLTNAVRVLEDIEQSAEVQARINPGGSFEAQLREACPTWRDPLCHGVAFDTINGLARVLARRCADILVEAKDPPPGLPVQTSAEVAQ